MLVHVCFVYFVLIVTVGLYTVGHKKGARDQPIFMQFSLLDFEMNDT